LVSKESFIRAAIMAAMSENIENAVNGAVYNKKLTDDKAKSAKEIIGKSNHNLMHTIIELGPYRGGWASTNGCYKNVSRTQRLNCRSKYVSRCLERSEI
jgi:hypothetical protein